MESSCVFSREDGTVQRFRSLGKTRNPCPLRNMQYQLRLLAIPYYLKTQSKFDSFPIFTLHTSPVKILKPVYLDANAMPGFLLSTLRQPGGTYAGTSHHTSQLTRLHKPCKPHSGHVPLKHKSLQAIFLHQGVACGYPSRGLLSNFYTLQPSSARGTRNRNIMTHRHLSTRDDCYIALYSSDLRKKQRRHVNPVEPKSLNP